MHIARTIDDTRNAIKTARTHGAVIGFVPTMGFLHAGHISLVQTLRDAGATFIVASIFVNPRQFGPNEDFARYPRDEERDAAMLEAADVELLFLPSVEVMYPEGATTSIHIGGVSEPLEGERRPGHFDGVATVVAKLFNIVQPDLAAFGRKDAQQCAVIERLVRDLDIPLQLVFGETLRERDGLAMSSRNAYLSEDDRAKAPVLHRALRAGEEAIARGTHDVAAIEQVMQRVVGEERGVEIDYLAVIDPETFLPPVDFAREVLLAGALRVGRTRLIDNIRVSRR
ncbi:MAG TPA: pantoate--beta-alanine ligase [Thermoanaerobaculia bacterium]|nr:pantoate--beta-alanine ligase [Thermoanaerobaculia bacterium]